MAAPPGNDPMRLYDTARGGGRPVRARPGRHDVHVRHHALRRDPPRARRRLRHLRRAPAAPARPRPRDACVRNITDVDDSILRKARELGVHYLDLAAAETARFDDDMDALGVLPCRASRGPPRPSPTSAASSAWCSTAATPTRPAAPSTSTWRRSPLRPGRATRREEMLAYAAERGGNADDPNKRDPLDFVLWQPSADDEPAWESLWGRAGPAGTSSARRWPARARHHDRPARRRGRPDLPPPRVRAGPVRGRHRRAVRAPLDAPGDGADGRREDVEVARQPRVRVELRKEWDPLAIRLAIVEHHYRTAWEWDDTACRRPLSASSAGGAAAGEGDGGPRRGAGRPRRRPRHAPPRSPPSTRPPPRRPPGERLDRRGPARHRPTALTPRDEDQRGYRTPVGALRMRGRPSAEYGSSTRSPRHPPMLPGSIPPRARARRRRPGHLLPQPHLGDRLVLPAAGPAPADHLRGQGRVHGLLEDQVPLPGHGHDPDRPQRGQRQPSALNTAARRARAG